MKEIGQQSSGLAHSKSLDVTSKSSLQDYQRRLRSSVPLKAVNHNILLHENKDLDEIKSSGRYYL